MYVTVPTAANVLLHVQYSITEPIGCSPRHACGCRHLCHLCRYEQPFAKIHYELDFSLGANVDIGCGTTLFGDGTNDVNVPKSFGAVVLVLLGPTPDIFLPRFLVIGSFQLPGAKVFLHTNTV